MEQSADTREKLLYERLTALGIAYSTIAHEPVFTVEEAEAFLTRIPGGHTKNLFLKDKKDGLWLVVADAYRKVDLPELARRLGAPRFSFGSAELLIATLGIEPGSVNPFALMNDTAGKVTAVLDAAMLKNDPVNFHPMRNDRTTAIAPADLVRFVEATGHKPVIADLPEKSA